MKRERNKFKKGAAAFYIVAVSTLILIIIATSFAAIMIAEMTRTSNEDLSQSAYDSAMAGVEDAKLAFYNYRKCLKEGATANEINNDGVLTCDEVVWLVEKSDDCTMVGRILGRINESDEKKEIAVRESANDNNMQQAYTCTKIKTTLKDIRGTLSSTTQIKAIRAIFDNVNASEIKKVRISWFSDVGATKFEYSNFKNNGVVFPKYGDMPLAVPPTISLALLQTAENFSLADFDMTKGEQTNKGMVYLVPNNNKSIADNIKANYRKAYDGTQNLIKKEGILKSNDKTEKNKPYVAYCPEKMVSDFACSVTIELPEPIGGNRNNETFTFVVALPYGGPTTNFMLEFFCDDTKVCSSETIAKEDGSEEVTTETSQANLNGVQIEIDSTGRANDLYRRVQARLENADAFSLSLLGPLELLGDGNSNSTLLEKNYTVTSEYNFIP